MDRELQGVEEAWRELRRRLADHVAGMEPRETLVVSAQVAGTEGGPSPYVLVSRGSDGGWRLEAVGHAYLDSAQRLGEAAEEALRALGWSPPGADGGPAAWRVDLPAGDVERGAWLLVHTLREAFAARRQWETMGRAAAASAASRYRADDHLLLIA